MIEEKRKLTSPFDFVNSINDGSGSLIEKSDDQELIEKEYNEFMVNRALSYYVDTIHFVNVLNKYHQIDKKLQYDFLLNAVRPRKRRTSWAKKQVDDNLQFVKDYFNLSTAKARSAISLLTDEQLAAMKAERDPGGMK